VGKGKGCKRGRMGRYKVIVDKMMVVMIMFVMQIVIVVSLLVNSDVFFAWFTFLPTVTWGN
jgi:hypothetical protein